MAYGDGGKGLDTISVLADLGEKCEEIERLKAEVERLLEILAETSCPPHTNCPLVPEGSEPDCRECWDGWRKKARE